MKRALTIICILLCFLGKAQTLKHNPNGYVDDYAGIYTADQKAQLATIIKSFWDTVQIAVVTVPSLDGRDVSEYATSLFNSWGVGSKSNNGLLLLIAPHEHKAFAATGNAIQGNLTDLMAARLQREIMAPEFKNGFYFAGTEKLLKAYIVCLSPSSVQLHDDQEKMKDKDTGTTGFILLVIFCGAVGTIRYGISKNRRKKRESDRAQKILNSVESKSIMRPWANSGSFGAGYVSGVASSSSYTPSSSSYDSGSSYSYDSGSSYSSYDSGSSSSSSDSSSGGSDFGGGYSDGGGGGSSW